MPKKRSNSKKESKQPEVQAVDAAHNSQNSLNWDGVYTGVIHCADCPGIEVQLTLNTDATYAITYLYQEKNNSYTYSGTFKWDETGNKITLDTNEVPPHYAVGENTITQLDMEGNKITGELADKYVLVKK
jgi:uncharacterized lipoprotein NlpE involved in copper resistance